MGRTTTPKTDRKRWTEADIARLRREYPTADITELAQALGRKRHQVHIKANRLGLHREVISQRRSSGRPAHTRAAMLRVLQAAGPEGIMLASLSTALPPGKRESAACALYAAVAAGESAFALKLGRYCRYYATAAWRDAAAAALHARHPSGKIAKPGTLRAQIQDLVINAAHRGITINGLDAALPGQLRAKINLAATWMANTGHLHCWGSGPGKRYFSTLAWLEAHAQAEHSAGRTAPSHLAPSPAATSPAPAPAPKPATPPAATQPASHSAAKRQRQALAKRAAALPGTRQIELATQRARTKGRLGTDIPWAPPTTSQPIAATIPPGLQIQHIESKACYRHQLAASNDSSAGAGLASAGIGRYAEPASSWVQAVAERRAA